MTYVPCYSINDVTIITIANLITNIYFLYLGPMPIFHLFQIIIIKDRFIIYWD